MTIDEERFVQEHFKPTSKLYIVVANGVAVELGGRSSWRTKGAAKAAVTNYLDRIMYGGWTSNNKFIRMYKGNPLPEDFDIRQFKENLFNSGFIQIKFVGNQQ